MRSVGARRQAGRRVDPKQGRTDEPVAIGDAVMASNPNFYPRFQNYLLGGVDGGSRSAACRGGIAWVGGRLSPFRLLPHPQKNVRRHRTRAQGKRPNPADLERLQELSTFADRLDQIPVTSQGRARSLDVGNSCGTRWKTEVLGDHRWV